jgi:hypothetical protein
MLQSSLVGHGSGQRPLILDGSKGRNRKAMIPKEKAIELVDLFKIGDVVVEKGGTNQIVNINAYAKLFALRAVDELIKYHDDLMDIVRYELPSNIVAVIPYKYWDDVKKEIERL